ncbi:MAG: isoprenylcysteine carboxylmethyltransferase family protein [Chloroflexota bacterium]|nr:MAG: isoprenylcysteine carboxylmethyltransferase family protein [Chloroflexota bacterium]
MKWKWSNVPITVPQVLGLGVGVILQFVFPMTIFQLQWIGYLLELPLIGIGIILLAWAVLETGTTNIESPDRLLTSGPYSFSRNPMYVGWGSLYLGVALIVNSVWIIALFPLVFAVTHFLDVIKEEQFLGEQFGEEYRDYQSRVRRYL